jgi:hypothetical protein
MSVGTEGQQQNEGGNSGFTPPASQEELNRIIEKRLERERSKFGDYDDLKAKAARLDEIEAANQTEAEKQAAKLTAAQQEAAEAKAEALRYRVATKFQVSDEDADLFLTGTDEETLTKQAQRLTERTDQRIRSGNVVRREGATTVPQEDELRSFTRQLFAGAQQE